MLFYDYIFMQPITLIKFGGSIITDKSQPYTLQRERVAQLAKEIKAYNKPLILAHGSGSFAHTSAKKYGGMKGYTSREGLTMVARDAMAINAQIMDILLEKYIPAISLRPMSMVLSDQGALQKHFFSIIPHILEQGFIPVVYGDVIWDRSWKTTIYSGERILGEIALYLQTQGYPVHAVIEVGITNGVYDEKDKTIPQITPTNWDRVQHFITGSAATDVTGGMYHKVKEAITLTEHNISTYIINGNFPKQLYAALHDMPTTGTLITQ